jgi:hypothetical protein
VTAPWDAGPCAWPDDTELDRQLAEAERASLDLDGPQVDDEHAIPADYGRSSARRHIPDHRPVTDVLEDL